MKGRSSKSIVHFIAVGNLITPLQSLFTKINFVLASFYRGNYVKP